MKKILLAGLLAAAAFGYEATGIDVEFKAFKTPLKIGVKGGFDKIALHSKEAGTLQDMLLGTSVVIDTASVNSKNPGRDKKLVHSFFNVQGVAKIEAKIVKVDSKVLTVAITMNGKTLDIPMKYEDEDKEIEAEGVIDLADFGMLPSLKAINKACYEMHQGKTWQDVELEFELKYKK